MGAIHWGDSIMSFTAAKAAGAAMVKRVEETLKLEESGHVLGVFNTTEELLALCAKCNIDPKEFTFISGIKSALFANRNTILRHVQHRSLKFRVKINGIHVMLCSSWIPPEDTIQCYAIPVGGAWSLQHITGDAEDVTDITVTDRKTGKKLDGVPMQAEDVGCMLHTIGRDFKFTYWVGGNNCQAGTYRFLKALQYYAIGKPYKLHFANMLPVQTVRGAVAAGIANVEGFIDSSAQRELEAFRMRFKRKAPDSEKVVLEPEGPENPAKRAKACDSEPEGPAKKPQRKKPEVRKHKTRASTRARKRY